MTQFGRKLIRLPQMSLKEFAARVLESWYGWKEWLAVVGGSTSSNGIASCLNGAQALALLDRMRRRPFYFCGSGSESKGLAESFQKLFPGGTEGVVQEAELICAGSLRLFGKTVTFANRELDWQLDWATGERLPLRFYRNITDPDPNRRAGPKRIWEMNRQQFLVTLGKAYLLTGRRKYAERAVSLIECWIDSNPPYRGANWMHALEESLRLISWIWTLRLIADTDVPTEESSRRMVGSLMVQWEHMRRHLSLYSSPNTHLLGEALGLFVAGLMFPELPSPGESVAQALSILEEQLERQVADDGSHREKASYYHCYALDMYLLATVLGRQHGVSFSPEWLKRVEKMAELLLAILRPDGSLARFGDDDGGRTLRLKDEDYYRPRALLAVAAVLFDREDFKWVAGELPEEVFWIFGPDGARRYLALPAKEPRQRAMWFPDASLAVLRTGWSANDLWLACQEQPMGFLTAGHSHAGLLSFELVLNGKLVLVDPGTYTYEVSNLWRDSFRRMEAHNVVQIDGKQCYSPAGPFRWEKIDTVQPLSLISKPGQSVKAGYRVRDAGGKELRHIRRFAVESSGTVSIHDHFEGVGKHRLRFWLHFAPDGRVRHKAGREFEIEWEDTAVTLALDGFGHFRWRLWQGSDDLPAGWVSPSYDHKIPAPTLCIEDEAEFPAGRKMWLRVVASPERDEPLGAASFQEKLRQGQE